MRFLKEAYERGVSEFVVFANSSPVWATKNGLAHPGDGATVGSSNLAPEKVDVFAQFLVNVAEYLRGDLVGVPVNHISPINEPTWEWEGQSQEGNRYNVEEQKAVYRAVYRALAEAGLSDSVHLDGAEVVEYGAALGDSDKIEFDGKIFDGGMNKRGLGLYRNYLDELLGDAEMRKILGNKISMHGYFTDAHSARMGRLRDLTWQNAKAASAEAKVWMSEFCILGRAGDARSFVGGGFDPDDMDYALHVGKVIHRDLTRLNASAWHWWLGLTPYDYKDGLVKIDSSLNADSMEDSKVLWVLGNYSRFVRPGYVRVSLPGVDDLEGVMASAYRSPEGDRLVVVVVNAGDATEEIELEVGGIPEGKGIVEQAIYLTNQDTDLTADSVGDRLYVPKRSVLSLVAEIR